MMYLNLAVWRSQKIKIPRGTLNIETTVSKSVNSVYRKVLNDMLAIKSYGLFLLFLVLTGCLAPPIKPSASNLNEIRTVLVVPVESPPLEVIPDLIETRFPVYRQYQYQAMPYAMLMKETIYNNPGGVLIAGLVSHDDSVPIANLPKTSASMEKLASLEPTASFSENWTPSFILAQEAVSQLNRDKGKAILSKHYYRLPIANGNRNANVGNWRNAIEQWYSQDKSAIDYRQAELENVDAVLEVGIENYRIFNAQTSLRVLIKLIDPNTQQVIGRISAKNLSVEDSPQTLLGHEAEKFKQLMSKMGGQLIAHGFSDLGLHL